MPAPHRRAPPPRHLPLLLRREERRGPAHAYVADRGRDTPGGGGVRPGTPGRGGHHRYDPAPAGVGRMRQRRQPLARYLRGQRLPAPSAMPLPGLVDRSRTAATPLQGSSGPPVLSQGWNTAPSATEGGPYLSGRTVASATSSRPSSPTTPVVVPAPRVRPAERWSGLTSPARHPVGLAARPTPSPPWPL